MTGYPPDSLVTVRPYTHRRDADTATIGDVDRQVYLAIPNEGLDILEWLAAGHTVGAAASKYQEKYAETPDMEDFLLALEDEGFVAPASAPVPAAEAVPARPQFRKSWTMDWLSQRTAQRLVSLPVLVVCGIVIVAAVALVVDDPGVLPTPGKALLFPYDFALLTWITVAAALAGVTLHEVAHVVAARAAGVPARIGIGNQLYVLVAQTDMTGIWLAPRRHRYLAFMIGSIVDAFSGAFLIGLLWADRHGLMHVPRTLVLLSYAVLLGYLTRLGWQWFLFLRTDGYYVISTAAKCKNLLGDTEDYLRNLLAKLRLYRHRVDQSGVPRREMRIVRVYALVWILGRLFALSVMGFVGIPVIWSYVYQVLLAVTGQHSMFHTFDFVTITVLTLALDGGGLAVWVVGLVRGGVRRRRERVARAERRAARAAETGVTP